MSIHNGHRLLSGISVDVIASLLSLRGVPTIQPFVDDITGDVICFNGQVFAGLDCLGDQGCDGDAIDDNDTIAVLHALCETDGKKHSVMHVLSRLKGAFSFVYIRRERSGEECGDTLWFGRDCFGRRSLLFLDTAYDLSTSDDALYPGFILSSTAFQPSASTVNYDSSCWREITPGIYSFQIINSNENVYDAVSASIVFHPWLSDSAQGVASPERRRLVLSDSVPPSSDTDAENAIDTIMRVLSIAVRRRVKAISKHSVEMSANSYAAGTSSEPAAVSILFSGGLDSVVLAALTNSDRPSCEPIDLISINFGIKSSADWLAAINSWLELQLLFPQRPWRLVLINVCASDVEAQRARILRLIAPRSTVMDYNIGSAFWFASSGNGYLCDDKGNLLHSNPFVSAARVVLVGIGADEQLGGYGRHRTAYDLRSWTGLQAEMEMDFERIWHRNLGRDDRCISDRGKDARFPYLDEDFVSAVSSLPLWRIADMRLGPGHGDKWVLRQIAYRLGLKSCSDRVKRAIQFGSNVAKECNPKFVKGDTPIR